MFWRFHEMNPFSSNYDKVFFNQISSINVHILCTFGYLSFSKNYFGKKVQSEKWNIL